eukprot:7026_1
MSSATSVIVPNLGTALTDGCSDIQENDEFINKKAGELHIVFVKHGSNHRNRCAELLAAHHFMIFMFPSELQSIKDATTMDKIHLTYDDFHFNKIKVTSFSQNEFQKEYSDEFITKLNNPHTIYNKSYWEIIQFCKAKNDEKSVYHRKADNCHKFCIDFATFCNVDYDEINFTKMEGCWYGFISFIKFCSFCISDTYYRGFIYSLMFFLWSIFATAWWSQINSFNNSFKSPFDSCATGAYFILFASFINMIALYCFDGRCTNILCSILFIVGGICYWFGGFAVTTIFNKTLHSECDHLSLPHKGYCSAFSGMWFTECSLIGVSSVIFGIDIWIKVLKYRIFRKFVNFGLLSFVSLVGFFCYAILSTNLKNIQNHNGKGSLATIASAYFFIFCISTFYVIWVGYKYYAVNEQQYDSASRHRWGRERTAIDIICVICTVFFGFILVCGYWAISSHPTINKSALDGTNLNETYLTVYWIGMSLFWIFYLFIIISDMHIGTPQSFNIRDDLENYFGNKNDEQDSD